MLRHGPAHCCLGNEREALYYLRQSIREACDIKTDFIALDALVWVAMLRAKHSEKENALELFSLIRHHPKTDPETIQSMVELLPQISDGLGGIEINVVEESGKAWELSEIVESVLKGD